MRLLCVSAELPGHLDWGGYLDTAATLVARGHTLCWASGKAVAPQVEQAGVPIHILAETGWRWPPPPPLQPDPNADQQAVLRRKQLRALDQWLDEARVAVAVEELTDLAETFEPDLILAEMFMAAAAIVAERVDCPLAVVGWPAPATRRESGAAADGSIVREARGRLDALLAKFQVSGLHWTSEGPPALNARQAHLTFWSPSWFADMPTGPQTVHFGGLQHMPQEGYRPDPSLPSPDREPWVLITLGTSFNADPNFFIAAAHAAEQMGCLPILALGAPLTTDWVQKLHGRLPRSAVMRERVDFARVLPDVAAAVHHGGAGTTHALVTHAIPQIVVPHAGDQMRQAQGVLRSGVGLYLPPKEVTIPRLVDALAQTLPDRAPLRAQAKALQAEFHALGGIPAAATHIEMLRLQH